MVDTPIPVVRLVPGRVEAVSGSTLGVNVGGTYPPVWWPAGYIPAAGDSVKVLMVDGTAVVHSPVVATERPLTGTVAGTASGGLVPVSTTAGTLQCRYVGTAPSSGALVRLDWQATAPWIWPSAAAATPTPPPDQGGGPTPPPVDQNGVLSVTALDSATWNTQYRNWTGQNGLNLTQGSWGAANYTGAWWYGTAPQQVAGRTVTRFQVRLGARRHIGSYNSPLALQVYRTTDLTRPGGDTNRVEGPTVITLAPDAGPAWVDLPVSMGQAIADSGGGLAIAGGSYGGVAGIGEDPASGQLFYDWKA